MIMILPWNHLRIISNSSFVTKMENNNMHNMEHKHTHFFTRVSSTTGNVWSANGEGALSQTVSLNLHPAATNWLEPSQSGTGGEGGSEWEWGVEWWLGGGVRGGGELSLGRLRTQSSGREMEKGLDFSTVSQAVVTRWGLQGGQSFKRPPHFSPTLPVFTPLWPTQDSLYSERNRNEVRVRHLLLRTYCDHVYFVFQPLSLDFYYLSKNKFVFFFPPNTSKTTPTVTFLSCQHCHFT